MSIKDILFVKQTEDDTKLTETENIDETVEPVNDTEAEEDTASPSKKMSKRSVIISAVCVAVAVIYLAGYFLYLAKVIPNRFDKNYQDIMALYGQPSAVLLNGANESFGAMYEINSDLAGIVNVPGTSINYPFVKPKNYTRQFYDEHLFNLVRCKGGTPYTTDGYSVSGFTNNTVIYGQSYKGRMFSDLSNYTDIDYYRKHPIIDINTLFEHYRYKIFAVSVMKDSNTFDFETDDFKTGEELEAYYNNAQNTSSYYTDISVNIGDKLAVLSTEYEYGGKIVVFARTLRDGEAQNLENDYVAYKSSNLPPPTDDSSTQTDKPVEQPDIEQGDIVTEEGDIPQNEQNAGAILPSVEDDTPIFTEPMQPQTPSSSAGSSAVSSNVSSKPNSSASSSSSAVSSTAPSDTSSLGSSSTSSSVVITPEEYVVTTEDTYLRVREGPGTTFKEVGRVDKGETITVLRISDGWAEITASGGVAGWVSADYITKKSELNSSSNTTTSSSSGSSSENVDKTSPEGYVYFNPEAANEIITVKSSLGNTYTESAYSIICRIVEMEVGSGYPVETIKAQAVASYSYIMYRVRRGTVPTGVAMKAYSAVGTRVKQCVASVIGKTLVYNGKICDSYYATCTAGKTNDVRDVWSSGSEIPYLTPVDSSIDKKYQGFTYKKQMSADDVIKRVKDKLNIDLSTSKMAKSSWFKIIDRNKSGVYNGKMSIAGYSTYKNSSGKTYDITGQKLYSVFSLRSAAFDVSYNSSTDTFTFTTYGWGHGVGMSQVGAYYYALDYGWNYMQILLHYYPGATLRDYA